MSKTCAIFNYAPHYRKSIYLLMEKELNADFYFGDKIKENVKKLDYSHFKNKVTEIKNVLLFGPVYYQRGVIRLLFNKNYDKYIITGETYSISTFLFLLLAKFTRKKVYLWGHGCRGNESPINIFIKRVSSLLYDGFFLYGNYAKRLLVDRGIDEGKLHVIYNSLDYDMQKNNRDRVEQSDIYEQYFDNNCKTLFFVGRLTRSKRLDMLIDALGKLKAEGYIYNLVLIGGGDEEESLRNYVSLSGLSDNVWFYGECYDEKLLSKLIYNADLCVSPGNIGLTAIHSLAYGTPVITHDNFEKQGPEFEAIVENETGLFFKYESVASLTEKIQEWFALTKKETRDSIAEKCYHIVDEKYNPHRQIEMLKSVMLAEL